MKVAVLARFAGASPREVKFTKFTLFARFVAPRGVRRRERAEAVAPTWEPRETDRWSGAFHGAQYSTHWKLKQANSAPERGE
jgi:hypothetical protein